MSERKEIKNLKRIIETENRCLWFDDVCYAAMNLIDDLDNKIEELDRKLVQALEFSKLAFEGGYQCGWQDFSEAAAYKELYEYDRENLRTMFMDWEVETLFEKDTSLFEIWGDSDVWGENQVEAENE